MTKIGQMLMDEGMEKGTERGMRLAEKLLAAGRKEDYRRAAKDKEFREQLMKEFKI